MKKVKGMRDILPEEMIARERVFQIISETYREFGYVPLETPALEMMKTLTAKSGAEIAGQIFRVEEELGLRFEFTVSLARVAAQTTFPKPFKRYQMGPVWRKEEPQKGRFREFWQADADIVGCPSMRADAELLEVANTALNRLGFEKPRITLSNRKILNDVFEKLGIKKPEEAMRILDKLDKLEKKEVERQLEAAFKGKGKKLLGLLSEEGDNDEKLEGMEKYSPEGVKEVREIMECFPNFELDLTLARGLAYYTGPVYEFREKGLGSSIAGGGRYDTMLKIFGKDEPAAGISLGVERIMMLLPKKEKKATYTKVFVASFPETYKYALQLAKDFRGEGIPAETDLMGRSLRKQFDYANAESIPYIAIAGKKEMEQKKLTLRNMKSGEEELLTFIEAAERAGA